MEDLGWADGMAFCTPARYGNMSAQMKNFIDKTGNLWQKGALINKVAGVFTSASSVSGPMASRMPIENDLEIAKTLGRRIAEIAKKISGK